MAFIRNNDFCNENGENKMVVARSTALLGKARNTYKSLARKLEENRPPGRPRIKWEDNIKIVVT
jgi:hypothetical protein